MNKSIWILLIALALAPTVSAVNIFYTTQPANATEMGVNGYARVNDTGF